VRTALLYYHTPHASSSGSTMMRSLTFFFEVGSSAKIVGAFAGGILERYFGRAITFEPEMYGMDKIMSNS